TTARAARAAARSRPRLCSDRIFRRSKGKRQDLFHRQDKTGRQNRNDNRNVLIQDRGTGEGRDDESARVSEEVNSCLEPRPICGAAASTDARLVNAVL